MNKDGFKQGVADAIRQLRVKRGLTLTELGAQTGVTAEAVRQWESARNSPTVPKLPVVALALGVTTVELVKRACRLGGVE